MSLEQRQKAQSVLGQVYQNVLSGIGNLAPTKMKGGFKDAMDVIAAQRKPVVDQDGKTIESAVTSYSVFDPRFKAALKEDAGITFREKPQEFIGAYAARLLTDIGSDSTRHAYWRYNHPMAIADEVVSAVGGEPYRRLSPTKKAAVGLTVGAPTAASMGVFDLTNPGELFRSKGFAQSYAETGSEDRRQTAQPGLELAERMFLGRQGRPLKYETAKQDIPDLTPERYGRYMKGFYQDKGVTGLGLLKFTPENLQGEPEARIVGFPIGLQSVGALAGGTAALRAAGKPEITVEQVGKQTLERKKYPKARVMAGATLAGALGGALAGKMANLGIASLQNNPERLPSTLEY